MFKELLAKLRALSLYYKTAHWQVRGSIYYGDHLLLDRLAGETTGMIDAIAEKAVGLRGVESVNLIEHLSDVYMLIENMPTEAMDNKSYFEAALRLEKMLLESCEQYDKMPESSTGVRNMLGDIADKSESRIYLLKQRLIK